MSFMDRGMLAGAALREERRARLVKGTLRRADGTLVPILVRNLSERGLGINCKAKPPLRGEAVTITLPGSDDLDGVVRWARGQDIGVELSATVDTEDLATAIREELARMKESGDWTVSARHRVVTPRTDARRRI